MKKGSKHNKKSIKKMSEIKKGKIFTDEHKRKIGKANKGKIFTDEHKRNLSLSHIGIQAGKNNPNYGKKHTDKTKLKISKSRKNQCIGENNPAWKGGIAYEPYCDVWIDKEYKESIKERDNYTCQNPFCLCDSSK